MESIECDKCGKVIEGYTLRQISFLLEQHKLTHKKKLMEMKNANE